MRLILFLFISATSIVNAEDRCPNYNYETLVGNWYGEQLDSKNNAWQKWVVSRKDNGTYTIKFTTTFENNIDVTTEEGLWSYSKCLYSVAVEKVNGKDVNYQEVYLVNDINTSYMDYTNYRTKNNWRIFKEN